MQNVRILETARAVAGRFVGLGEVREVAPLGRGLINDTFAVEAESGSFVLQRLNPIFDARIHWNIEAVTEHLAKKGVSTPRLVQSEQRKPWLEQPDGAIWRMQTRLAGVTFDRMEDAAQARAAGTALGRFHGALADLEHEFVGLRAGVHDTEAHLANLRTALDEYRGHRLYRDVAPLADAILRGAQSLPPCPGTEVRVVHGDPKLNNIVFEGDDPLGRQRPVGLVDLDTVGSMALHLELGDAWRSWCNRAGEDETSAAWDDAVFEAAVQGWAESRPFDLRPAEASALLHGVEWITLELAARFAADALAERYFGFDPERFATRGEHNLLRALGQWSLHRAVLENRAQRREVLHRWLG